jgi:alanine-glyoxylate transaminase/(R)-3-amino-2-methylpropionate-pyruvate transaminase
LLSFWELIKDLIFKCFEKIKDVYRGVWGGNKCRDSPVQSLRECSCNTNECNACDKYVEQFNDVLIHSTPKGGKIAAFFAESIQGVGGTVQFPKNFIKKVAQQVQSNGGLYVADEV